MKKKFRPGVLLTAFALSLFMSMSLKHVQAQILTNPTQEIGNPAAEKIDVIGGGKVIENTTMPVVVQGFNPTGEENKSIITVNPTGTGGTIGATPKTATGVTVGPAPTTATGGTIGATTTITNATNECIEVEGRGQVCGAEAVSLCRQFPKVGTCPEILKGAEARRR